MRRFRLPTSRRTIERDLDDELALHMALRTEALERSGMTPAEAKAEAERLFGDATAIRSDCLTIDEANHTRSARWDLVGELRQDLAYAFRTITRDVSFSLLAVLILALGIGATTALFSVYDRVVLRPVEIPEPERVVMARLVAPDGGDNVAPAAFVAWRERTHAFERLASVRPISATLVGNGDPARLSGMQVSEGFFETLRLAPLEGRMLQGEDYAKGSAATVMLSSALWRERFGGDPRVVGKSLDLDGELRTVVGIFPDELHAVEGSAQFVVPDALPLALRDNWTPFLSVVGRLRPGVSEEGAQRELQAAFEERWRATRREPLPARAQATPIAQYLTSAFRDRITLLLAGVVALLLIGCVNVGNLLLSRGATRGREMALRTSLGASRGRLVRQLVTEHAALAVLGGVGGLLLAIWMVRAIAFVLPPDLPRAAAATIDLRAMAVAIACGGTTLLVAGLVPALRASRVDVREAMQGGGRGATAGRSSDRLRRAFVVAQVGATTVLLVVAGLLVRSSEALGRVAPGFATDDVLTARYSLPSREYDTPAKVLQAHARVRESVRGALGGDVALASSIPLGGDGGGSGFLAIGGEKGEGHEVNAGLHFVSPGYLKTMGIALLRGRDVEETDRRESGHTVVISEALARALGLGDDAIGRFIGGTASPFKDSTGAMVPMQVVGIVRAPRNRGLRDAPDLQVFFPLAQTPDEVFDWSARSVHVVARGGSRQRTTEAIAAGVHAVDPKLPLEDVRTMGERLRASVALERANTMLLGALALAALLLAVTGLYGVIAFAVTQRRPEIGVRLALGAVPGDIVRMIVQWGGRLVAIGLVVGLPLALAAARTLSGLLFGVTPFDVVTLGGVAALLAVVGVVSALVPARRASTVAPGSVLRS